MIFHLRLLQTRSSNSLSCSRSIGSPDLESTPATLHARVIHYFSEGCCAAKNLAGRAWRVLHIGETDCVAEQIGFELVSVILIASVQIGRDRFVSDMLHAP